MTAVKKNPLFSVGRATYCANLSEFDYTAWATMQQQASRSDLEVFSGFPDPIQEVLSEISEADLQCLSSGVACSFKLSNIETEDINKAFRLHYSPVAAVSFLGDETLGSPGMSTNERVRRCLIARYLDIAAVLAADLSPEVLSVKVGLDPSTCSLLANTTVSQIRRVSLALTESNATFAPRFDPNLLSDLACGVPAEKLSARKLNYLLVQSVLPKRL